MALPNVPIQDTKCIPPDQVTRKEMETRIAAGAAISAALAGLGALASGANGPQAAVIGLYFAPFGGLTGYCDWFFNHRLVCIKDEEHCIGTVISSDVGPDGDDTLHILLAPATPGWDLTKLQQDPSSFQARLMTNAFPQFPELKFAPPGDDSRVRNTPLFVIEVEGTRMKAICAGTSVGMLLGGGVATAIIRGCVAAAFLGLVGCFIQSLLWLGGLTGIGLLIGYKLGGTASTQDPESFSNSVGVGDCIGASGRFVYDPGYQGWNEIHPVLRLQKFPPVKHVCDGQLTEDQHTKIVQALRECESTQVRSSELNHDDNRFLVHRTVG